jgi:hypothetical protein
MNSNSKNQEVFNGDDYDLSTRRLRNADGYAISGESEFSRERSNPFEMVDYLIDQEVDQRGRGPKGYDNNDDRIYEKVCGALFQSPDIDASEIEVQVNGGVVTFEGMVSDVKTCHLILLLTSDIMGVTSIKNRITIQHC